MFDSEIHLSSGTSVRPLRVRRDSGRMQDPDQGEEKPARARTRAKNQGCESRRHEGSPNIIIGGACVEHLASFASRAKKDASIRRPEFKRRKKREHRTGWI